MNIYLSGKITGLKDYGKKSIDEAEKYLKKKYNCKIVNPLKLADKILHKINHSNYDDIPREIYLLQDLKELLKCDNIYMLKNWKQSKGSKLEHEIAKEIGINIMYQ